MDALQATGIAVVVLTVLGLALCERVYCHPLEVRVAVPADDAPTHSRRSH